MTTSPSYWGNYSDRDQPTLNTVADYISDARTLLQDKITPYRYEDSSLLVALNVTLLEARRLRGDLFVFNLRAEGQAQSFVTVDDTFVDMEPQFRVGILYGLCAHTLMRDQEETEDVRAQSFTANFNAILTGRTMVGPAGGTRPGT